MPTKRVVPGRGMDPARAVHIIGEVAKALDHRAERHALPGSSASHPRARRNGQHEKKLLEWAQRHESSGAGRRCPPRVPPPGCPNAAISRGRVCHSTPGEWRPWPDASRRTRPPLWRSLLRRSLLGPRCGRCATRGQLRLILQGGAAGDVQRGAQRRRPLSGVLTQLANVLGVLGAQRLALGLGLLAGPLDRLARFSGDQLISLRGLLGGDAGRIGRRGRGPGGRTSSRAAWTCASRSATARRAASSAAAARSWAACTCAAASVRTCASCSSACCLTRAVSATASSAAASASARCVSASAARASASRRARAAADAWCSASAILARASRCAPSTSAPAASRSPAVRTSTTTASRYSRNSVQPCRQLEQAFVEGGPGHRHRCLDAGRVVAASGGLLALPPMPRIDPVVQDAVDGLLAVPSPPTGGGIRPAGPVAIREVARLGRVRGRGDVTGR